MVLFYALTPFQRSTSFGPADSPVGPACKMSVPLREVCAVNMVMARAAAAVTGEAPRLPVYGTRGDR